MNSSSYHDQVELMDKLAKEMKPTRNGPITVVEYIRAVELLFKQNGWNFSTFCEMGGAKKWKTDETLLQPR